MPMVYVHLDERAGSNLLLAIGYHPRYRVAALLAGNERAGNYLQPAMDQTKVVQASLKTKFISASQAGRILTIQPIGKIQRDVHLTPAVSLAEAKNPRLRVQNRAFQASAF